MRTRPVSNWISFAVFVAVFAFSARIETSTRYEHIFRLTGDGKLTLVDMHTGEGISVTYRDGNGLYDDLSLDAIDRVMRCHGDQETYPISLKLVELIDHLQDHFGSDEVLVVSGYRSPEYNASLKRRSRRVAHDSLHMRGMAMDIKLPAVEKQELGAYVHPLSAGGVGVYRRSQFVHIDTGPVRRW